MKNLFISIITMFIGGTIGGLTGLDFYIMLGAICGLLLPSIYYIGKIHDTILKK